MKNGSAAPFRRSLISTKWVATSADDALKSITADRYAINALNGVSDGASHYSGVQAGQPSARFISFIRCTQLGMPKSGMTTTRGS